MGRANARPRVIRGTRTAPLPLLPSGPGGVCGRPLHGARDLTSIYRSMGGNRGIGNGVLRSPGAAESASRRGRAGTRRRIRNGTRSRGGAEATRSRRESKRIYLRGAEDTRNSKPEGAEGAEIAPQKHAERGCKSEVQTISCGAACQAAADCQSAPPPFWGFRGSAAGIRLPTRTSRSQTGTRNGTRSRGAAEATRSRRESKRSYLRGAKDTRNSKPEGARERR